MTGRQPREWLSPQQAARMFGVDTKSIARWDKAGRFKAAGIRVTRTLGSHRRFHRADIENYLNGGPQA